MKERIVQLMTVPLIQGTLRYVYITIAKTITEKAEAEGATFAATVLPIVHACSPNDAKIIYDNMRQGKAGTDFAAVKEAFKRNYPCIGIACSDVGGIFDDANAVYLSGAEPCGVDQVDQNGCKGTWLLVVGLSVTGVGVLVLLVLIVNSCTGSNGKVHTPNTESEQRNLNAGVSFEVDECCEEEVPTPAPDPRRGESQTGIA
jgi:hypothetical protein